MDASIADRDESWPVTATRDLHRDDWVVALREDTIARPDEPGETFTRLVLEHPGAVIALAVDEDERVCCIRQDRHPAQRNFVELPAGLLDASDEDPVETARRELREEVELEAEQWRHLLSTYPSVGITGEVQHFYLARGLRHADRGDFTLEHEEADLERFWVPMAELLDAVLDGRMQQGPVATALLAYDVLKRRGEL